MPQFKRVSLLGVVLLASFLTSACFEVVFGVTDQSVRPGDDITFTAVILPIHPGMEAPVRGYAYIEYPDTWTLVDGQTMQEEGGFPSGGDHRNYLPEHFFEVTEASCTDGVTTDLVPYSPRLGYRVGMIGWGNGGPLFKPESWGAIRIKFIVDGEPGAYPVRLWGGTQDETYSSYPSCAWEEIPIHITMFADDFETGDTSAWDEAGPV